MNRLVCNKESVVRSRRLYKKTSHLVRTPISKTFTISPTGQFLYDVGDRYRQVIPTSDFFTNSTTGNYAIISGHHMRRSYLGTYTPSHDSSGWAQIWRNNGAFSLQNDTGFVFYNGSYSPAQGIAGGSAFIRVPAYKFVIPSEITQSEDYEWTVSKVVIRVKSHGVVLTNSNATVKKTNSSYYPVFAIDANTNLLPANSAWRNSGIPIKFGAFNYTTLVGHDARDLYPMCQSLVYIPNERTDACSNLGAVNGFPLWITWPGSQGVSYNDGHIINAPASPLYHDFTMDSTFLSEVEYIMGDGQIYITMIQNVSDSGYESIEVEGQDFPSYYHPRAAWWMCERFQIVSMTLTVSIE